MDTSSVQDKEEKVASEECKDKRKKVEHDIDEGNIATAAAAALASAATKAKVSICSSAPSGRSSELIGFPPCLST